MFWKRFENKSHQRRAHYLKPRRNGGPMPTGGGGGGGLKEPPHTHTDLKPKIWFGNWAYFIKLGLYRPSKNCNILPKFNQNCKNCGLLFHLSRYWSTISWFEIMSSPLVTFIFKTLPKHRATQFWNFLPEILKICNQRQLVSINFEKKKSNKIWFFQIFFK